MTSTRHELKSEKELSFPLKKSRNNRTLLLLLSCIIFLTAFGLYANTLFHSYVLDDYIFILENRVTKRGVQGITEIFSTPHRFGYNAASDELYRPLTKSLFAMQWALSPNNPTPGHCMNVLLFAVTGIVLFYVLRSYSGDRLIFAFITTLLFIAHPIHTEVVANIKSLDEILSLLFSLCTLLYVFQYTQTLKKTRIGAAAFCFFCALMSKESSITFLLIVPLAVYLFTDAQRKQQCYIFSPLLFVTVIFVLIRWQVTGLPSAESHNAIDNILVAAPDSMHRIATAVYILGLYLKLLFIPNHLVSDYSFNQIPIVGPGDYRFIIPFIIFICITVFAVIKLKKEPWISFSILFFFVTSSVSSNIFITIGTSMGERLMYTPSLSWCVIIGYYVSKVTLKSVKDISIVNPANSFVLIVILILFSIKTISRNTVWKDNYTLFESDVKLSPQSARMHYNLGSYINKDEFLAGKTTLEKDSIIQRGIAELKKSVEIYPEFCDAWNILGVIYDKMNKRDSALYCYEKALASNPGDPTVHNNIGTLFYKHGKYTQAKEAFENAVQINPNSAAILTNLGSCYGALADYDLALNNFNHAVQIDPYYAPAYYLKGVVYRILGNERLADVYMNKANEMKSLGRE